MAIILYQHTAPKLSSQHHWALTKQSRKIDTLADSRLVTAQGKSAHLPGPAHRSEGRGQGLEESVSGKSMTSLRSSNCPTDAALTLGHPVPQRAPSSLPAITPTDQERSMNFREPFNKGDSGSSNSRSEEVSCFITSHAPAAQKGSTGQVWGANAEDWYTGRPHV